MQKAKEIPIIEKGLKNMFFSLLNSFAYLTCHYRNISIQTKYVCKRCLEERNLTRGFFYLIPSSCMFLKTLISKL